MSRILCYSYMYICRRWQDHLRNVCIPREQKTPSLSWRASHSFINTVEFLIEWFSWLIYLDKPNQTCQNPRKPWNNCTACFKLPPLKHICTYTFKLHVYTCIYIYINENMYSMKFYPPICIWFYDIIQNTNDEFPSIIHEIIEMHKCMP